MDSSNPLIKLNISFLTLDFSRLLNLHQLIWAKNIEAKLELILPYNSYALSLIRKAELILKTIGKTTAIPISDVGISPMILNLLQTKVAKIEIIETTTTL